MSAAGVVDLASLSEEQFVSLIDKMKDEAQSRAKAKTNDKECNSDRTNAQTHSACGTYARMRAP